jgi:S1-C subfamily serine protease
MHDGFAGGAFISTEGRLIGITTPASIRGLAIVIPAGIAWKTIDAVLQHGKPRRAYLGIAGQPARLAEAQQIGDTGDTALLVVAVTAESPAARGGVHVGDVILDIEGKPVLSAEDLLDLLTGDRIGHPLSLRVLRGTSPVTLTVTPSERPER